MRDKHLFGPGPKRILALDGGGTLGVIEIAFLEKIEGLLRDRYRMRDLRLCDYFDLIGGTSTGALVATALAMGMTADEVKQLYFEVGPKAFRKPWLSIPFFRPRFISKGLETILKDVLGERELQTPDLKTGLAIIAKRVDTGSPWVLTNNPKAIYWEDRPAEPENRREARVGNRRYKLREIIRASTAAPYFFAPQRLQILSGKLHGLFVDGGVSPYNNPSMQLLMLAGISRYGFNWPLGKENVLLISIGTGWARPKISDAWSTRLMPAALAVRALHGVVWDSHMNAMTMLQWMSSPRRPWTINSEIKDLEGELLTGPSGSHLLSFQRYDVAFDTDWLRSEIQAEIAASEIERLNDFMNPSIMPDAYALAVKVAAVQVQAADFPTGFDVR